jgi:PIN domain nuclease of toxin-antitoxin system
VGNKFKYREKKLILPVPAEEWFLKAVEKHSLIVAPLSVSVLCKANDLPFHHRDPADRFIIATALLEKTSVITADNKFNKYKIHVIQ